MAKKQRRPQMIRYPDVSANHIAFVWSGDIWIVKKGRKLARRLTNADGEETYPRFSPNGKRIAYTANYGGSRDVYVQNVRRNRAQKRLRLTFHPGEDRMVGWSRHGNRILYASKMESGLQSFWQLFWIPCEGGAPEKLPLRYAAMGAVLSKDMLAFQTAFEYRTWKRYRGGRAPDIYLYDRYREPQIVNLTEDDGKDTYPMWNPDRERLYFLSDRGESKRFNLWVLDDLESKRARQLTFEEHDVQHPAIGPEEIVFIKRGRLFSLPLAETGDGACATPKEVHVRIPCGKKKSKVTVKARIERFDVSPDGKHAVFEARGELFTIAVKDGKPCHLNRTSRNLHNYLKTNVLW